VENEFLKKKLGSLPLKDKQKMIDPKHKNLSISQQCEVLKVHRSGLYYKPRPMNELDDKLMNHIDELHTMDPTIGTRRMKKMLENRGFKVGRHHVLP